MTEPRVSIALATYNGERYLAEQLASIRAQTLAPAELVVGDDGSTDGTMGILARFAEDAPFPVRILPPGGRLGYRLNFMRTAEACAGDLVAFCDQDDVWLPRKLEASAAAFADPTILASAHNVFLMTAEGDRMGRLKPPFADRTVTERDMPPFSFFPGFTMTIRRDLVLFEAFWRMSDDTFNVGERLGHDTWFFFLASAIGRMRLIGEELALYRQHPANVSGQKSDRSLGSDLAAKLKDRTAEYRRRVELARNRADILDAILEAARSGRRPEIAEFLKSHGASSDGIAELRDKYMTLEARSRRRAEIYGERSPLALAGRLGRSALLGDYGVSDPWRPSLLGLARDVVTGVAGAVSPRRVSEGR
ncbi:glycosyltransferase [Chthonobacter rhizosphaerae]|uniref:glycosyltransferase n=1 Tax=Chthonobacter rhizosphaerae TaxID=2735553 RepID=UPI0015EEF017|nr:glycosyltransferase [Chthonobacter rhizosphaerae]